MKLKYNRSINGAVVNISMSLTSLTTRERRALKALGYPSIRVEHEFPVSGLTIDIDCTIANFNELGEFVFQGSMESMPDVLDEASELVELVCTEISEAMYTLMASYREIENYVSVSSGEIRIYDGVCHVEAPTKY